VNGDAPRPRARCRGSKIRILHIQEEGKEMQQEPGRDGTIVCIDDEAVCWGRELARSECAVGRRTGVADSLRAQALILPNLPAH
jgi:hypothetical protein